MVDAVEPVDQQEARMARSELLLTVRLEGPFPPPPPPPPSSSPPKSWPARLVAWMGAELPKLLAAAVLLVLGFALKDSVDLAIKQRQLDLSYTKEMQGLLQQLYGQGRERGQPPTEPELKSAAILLAAYGEPALPGLLSVLRGSGIEMLAAAEGLNALALREPALLCQALPRLLGLRRQYEWQAHELAVQMLGQHGCQQARPALRRYLALVDAAAAGKPQALEALLREPAAAAKEDYPRLQRSVREALSQLEQPAL
jgi:hypothetical protein